MEKHLRVITTPDTKEGEAFWNRERSRGLGVVPILMYAGMPGNRSGIPTLPD
jgi:hypothetical protein